MSDADKRSTGTDGLTPVGPSGAWWERVLRLLALVRSSIRSGSAVAARRVRRSRGSATPDAERAQSPRAARVPLRSLYFALVGLGCSVALVAAGMGAQRAIDASQLSAPSASDDLQAGNLIDSIGSAPVAEPSARAAQQPATLGVHIPGAKEPSLASINPHAAPAVAIHIPRLGINRSLVSLHILPDQSLGVPKSFHDVGWWAEGPHPGAAGATVFAGHVSSTSGPGVFFRLNALRDGDRITVDRADHSSATFQVVGKASYPRSAFPDDVVYRTSGKPSIHLVTCDGGFNTAIGHHEDNLIVFADLVSTTPTPAERRAAARRTAAQRAAAQKAARKTPAHQNAPAHKASAHKASAHKASAHRPARSRQSTHKASGHTASRSSGGQR